MKILIPVLGFAASGGDRVLAKFAAEWVEQGHRVVFLTPQGEKLPFFTTSAEILAVSERGAIEPPGAVIETMRFRGLRKLKALYAGVRRIGTDYDVVLANHSLTPWPIILGLRSPRTLVYYIQAYEPEYYREQRAPIKAMLAALSYRLPFVQVANSEVYSHHAGVDPQAIVPPGVDGVLFHAKPIPRDFADGAPVTLGCIGRHEPAKGTRYVLEAFTLLAEQDPKIRLRVAYGNLPPGWTHPRCEIVVPRGDAELADYYRSIDIMIAPGTVQHGAPHYPVMEAMACGTPVVTTGYLPATPDNCWLVANRDSHDIARAVRAIVADRGYTERVQRAQEAMRALDWPVTAARMLDVFETALAARAGANTRSHD